MNESPQLRTLVNQSILDEFILKPQLSIVLGQKNFVPNHYLIQNLISIRRADNQEHGRLTFASEGYSATT